MKFAEVVRLLENVTEAGDGSIRASCPAHDDSRPSLSMRETDRGKILVKCFAGCCYSDIMAALERRRDRGAPVSERQMQTLRARARRTADEVVVRIIDYPLYDLNGKLVAIHERRENAAGEKVGMPWRMPDGTYGLNGRPVQSLPLYGSEFLKRYPLEAPIFLVEGEKAANALLAQARPAVGTVCGAHTIPNDDVLRCLVGRNITIWPDNDEQGRAHMARIAERLTALKSSSVRPTIGVRRT